jgi:hypothetical protein
MTAGASAATEAERARRRAEEFARRYDEERANATRWTLASETEARVAALLIALDGYGWTTFPDRRWPGTQRGNVDVLSVGPGGLLVVDVKAWAEARVDGGRLYRGQEDCQDDVDALHDLAALAEQVTADVGLPPLEVVPLLVLAGHRGVAARLGRVHVLGEHDLAAFCLRRGSRLSPEQVATVATVVEREFPPYDAQPALVSPVVREPVLPREPDVLFDLDALVEEELAAALRAPMQTWMTWLHPEQARFVRRQWSGPLRVTGPAGTGKTVLGLHRAAFLASTRPGRVLFATYVSTLPNTLATYYRGLSPETADRVEFVGLHKWALSLLHERGVAVRLDPSQAATTFGEAWEAAGAPLATLGAAYCRDEVDWVLKGRALTDFEQYRDLVRVGRGVRLRPEQRAAVWDLYETYDALLAERGVHDFNDVLALALAEVRREPVEPGYAAVVVDEVQDLTCVGVRLLHALVGDRPDAFVAIGDETQAVYPGGFTFAEAGVAVVGRAVRLRVNYRNAAEILRVATSVGAHPAFEDEERAGSVVATRRGGHAVRTEWDSVERHDRALVHAVRQALAMPHVAPDEVAVLAPTRALVAAYLRVLGAAGIPAGNLAEHCGRPDGRVQVGTVKRAKGLEFKYVLLPRLVPDEPARRPDETEAAYRERTDLAKRETYVAMTRARDGLWLGYLKEYDAPAA